MLFIFFKQKTAYEVRISDWSSDVCSSDLFGGRPEHHRQWNGQTVIDVHLVDDGHVEIVKDQALRDVPSEVGVPFHIGNRARAPAFVGGLVALATPYREGRNDVRIEGGCVVIVD